MVKVIGEVKEDKKIWGKKEFKNNKKEKNLSASSVFKASNNDRIIADSGASVHLTRNLEWFSLIHKLASPIALIVSVANGRTIWTTHVGDIEIEKSINRKQ